MTDKLTVRPAQAGEQAFLVTRAMGEFRRAHVHNAIIQSGAEGFIRAALGRHDGRAAVIDGAGVLVGMAIGAAGAVIACALPPQLREHSVRDELLRAIGAADCLPYVTWLVPPPWWAKRLLAPVLDPFRLLQVHDERTQES